MGQAGGTKSSPWRAKIPQKSPAGLVPGAHSGRNPLGAPSQTALWMLPHHNRWMLPPAWVSPYSWDPFGVVIQEGTTTPLWVRSQDIEHKQPLIQSALSNSESNGDKAVSTLTGPLPNRRRHGGEPFLLLPTYLDTPRLCTTRVVIFDGADPELRKTMVTSAIGGLALEHALQSAIRKDLLWQFPGIAPKFDLIGVNILH
ncbi:hypothetical protein FB451DRAFT_1176780 [Mycena latifolia]|nr:hypothetical protein FB451DRAFT_1176780 [Mycena latifolia]